MSRRPPPGGASTFVFGTYEGDKEPERNGNVHRSRRSAPGESPSKSPATGGLSPQVQKQIQTMIANSSDLGELIKKMQAISGVGQTTGSGGGGGNESAPEGGATQSARGAKGTGSDKVEAAQEALRQAFAQRGCDTLLRLGKKFKVMDDDGSKGVSYEEFKKGLKESGVDLSEENLHALFRHFDADCSGYISFDELSAGVRPPMSARRRKLVLHAFEVMDANGDGALTVDDVAGRYDASLHPDVVAGTHTEVEVLNNFLACFDGSLGPKSAIVTPDKLLAYYSTISASIDSDDYFELVLRNVWHMSGGDAAATRRLLVSHEDGSQTVEALEGDFDVSKDDLKAIKENLKEQGVPVVKVSLYGYVEDGSGGGGGGSGLMTSASSPWRKSAGASPSPEAAGSGRDASTAELEPEQAAATYKQRMAQSNVSFA